MIYHVRPQQPPPMLTAAMTPIPSPASRATTLPPLTANVARSEPKALPASGWHASGETASVYAKTSPTQAAHPQPMEQPRETVLR